MIPTPKKYSPAELIALNNKFYAVQTTSFDASRQTFWPGWSQLQLGNDLTVLDVAAGNLRFAKFLAAKKKNFSYWGIDSCEPLLSKNKQTDINWQVIDILQCLLDGRDWRARLPERNFNVIFCSAFLHHVPTKAWRTQLLTDFSDLVAPGGKIIISFWQFWPELTKLVAADLGEHDYLLTWQQKSGALRFAHHFTDEEIDTYQKILYQRGTRVVQDFRADGRNGQMNRYVVWEKTKITP